MSAEIDKSKLPAGVSPRGGVREQELHKFLIAINEQIKQIKAQLNSIEQKIDALVHER